MRLIFDNHLDLAMNALRGDRDLTGSVESVRQREGSTRRADGAYVGGIADGRGTCTLTLPELRQAGCVVACTTLLARCRPWALPNRGKLGVVPRADIDYPRPDMAFAAAMSELAWYRWLAEAGLAEIITRAEQLDARIAPHREPDHPATLGLILTMEGADPILEPLDDHLARWYDHGLRGLSLAHYGHSRFAGGTPDPRHTMTAEQAAAFAAHTGGGETRPDDTPDPHATDRPLTELGESLLDAMGRLHGAGRIIALDLTHTCDRSLAQALNRYAGPIYLSHSNCRALTDSTRENTDEQIKAVIARGGIVGVVFHNGMLTGLRGGHTPSDTPIDRVVDHLDHLCDLAGNTDHAAIGSDMDGGFGAEKTPAEIDRYRDLTALADAMSRRGYTDAQIDAVFANNAARFWRGVLTAPAT